MTLFTLREAALEIPGAIVIGDENVAFDRVSTDSRTAGPGDLFIAIKGINKLKKPPPAPTPAPPPRSEALLEEIRDLLARRAQ